MVIAEPEPSTVILMRRFADQAGLALEQLERRRAEVEAARRAEDMARLQAVTAALSLAATPNEVADTCLEHALSLGAEAGFVVFTDSHREAFDFASSQGSATTSWRRGVPSGPMQTCRSPALASGKAVWALTPEDMGAFTEASAPRCRLGRHSAEEGRERPGRAPPDVPPTQARERGRAVMAGDGGIAVRTRSGAKQAPRGGEASPGALGASAEHDRGALEHAHAERRRRGRRRGAVRRARARRGLRFVSRRGSRATLRALAWRGYPDELADDEISLETDTPETGAVRGEGWQLHTSEDVDPNLESKGDVSYAVAPWSPGGNA